MGLCAAPTLLMRPKRYRVIAFAGERSLAIYILHLMLFYGSPITMGMLYWFDAVFAHTLGPLTVTAIVGATLLSSILLLHGWNWLARDHPVLAVWSARIAWGGFFALFLLKP